VDGKLWTLVISEKQWRFLRALRLRGHHYRPRGSVTKHWQELEGTLPASGYEWSLATVHGDGPDKGKPCLRIDEPGGFKTDVDPRWRVIATEQGCTVGDLARLPQRALRALTGDRDAHAVQGGAQRRASANSVYVGHEQGGSR
jgi:hypothetical protein